MLLGRLVDSASFERLLQTRRRLATPHFAIHHLRVEPQPLASTPMAALPELSTGGDLAAEQAVEDLPRDGHGAGPYRLLGVVVPKRHARRAVTRSLLKRQIYAAGKRHAARLPVGHWVVRLHRPFDRTVYVSAASKALRAVARDELEALFRGVSQTRPS